MKRIAEFWISPNCLDSDCKYRKKCCAVNNPAELFPEMNQVKPALFVKANQFGRIVVACETYETEETDHVTNSKAETTP